jgi:hypothetical protein
MRRLCIWLEQTASLPSGSSATRRVGAALPRSREVRFEEAGSAHGHVSWLEPVFEESAGEPSNSRVGGWATVDCLEVTDKAGIIDTDGCAKTSADNRLFARDSASAQVAGPQLSADYDALSGRQGSSRLECNSRR